MAAGMLLVMIVAAPAFAQRDPFDPLVTKDSSSNVDATGNPVSGSPNNEDSNKIQPSNDSGALPTTGSDIDGWLAAAFLLVAVGAGAVAVAKTNSPQPSRITK
jgi:LPXTG-motif cell wall-anchored protein